MNVLITNDDGIDSPFLPLLVDAFRGEHAIVVAVPNSEQSWISKAMSRRTPVACNEDRRFGCTAFALGGTPSDCVNIALSHLVTERPDIVVSGINIGHNAGLAFVASSGTIGGALEGAFHGLPAIAASVYLPPEAFEKMRKRDRILDPELKEHVANAAATVLKLAEEIAIEANSQNAARVHSLNFPYADLKQAQRKRTVVANTISSSLFSRKGDHFEFEYSHLDYQRSETLTDRQCLLDGDISHTILDYGRLGWPKGS